MNKTLLAALLFSTTTLSLVHAGPENLAEPRVTWSKKQVKVCYADFKLYDTSQLLDIAKLTAAGFRAFSADEKLTIKTAVTSAYKKDVTGIEFTGWNDCSVDKVADAYLFNVIDNKQPFLGVASIGEGGVLVYVDTKPGTKNSPKQSYFEKSSRLKPFVALNTAIMTEGRLKKSQELALTAVHEFGHLAGLRHEHADPTMLAVNDKKEIVSTDKNCLAVGFKPRELPVHSTAKVSVYDANSVMNYCYLYVLQSIGLDFILKWENVDKTLNFEDTTLFTKKPQQDGMVYKVKIGLSQGDIHALNCLYKYPTDVMLKTCQGNYNPRTKK